MKLQRTEDTEEHYLLKNTINYCTSCSFIRLAASYIVYFVHSGIDCVSDIPASQELYCALRSFIRLSASFIVRCIVIFGYCRVILCALHTVIFCTLCTVLLPCGQFYYATHSFIKIFDFSFIDFVSDICLRKLII